MWDSDPNDMKDAIEAALGPEAAEYEIRFQPMFGGIMAYTFERPFASLSNAGIALKLPPEGRESLIGEGGTPLRYKPEDPPSKSYIIVPAKVVGDRGDALKRWLVASMSHVKTLPVRKKKPRKT